MTRYRRHPSAVSTQLGEEIIALHLERRRYYELNASAACVWRAIEQGADDGAVTDALARQFGLEPSEARPHARAALQQLLRFRLAEASD